jgi:large repetitive protein
MFDSARHRLWALAFVFILSALPLVADDVTVSGNVTFASLDGSSLDHDGAANGIFTVDDGDLTVLGTISCNDDSGTSACAMQFAVSGDIVIENGAAIYAENRKGGGNGGDVTFTAGGAFSVRGNGIVSTSRTSNGDPNSSRAGYITVNAGGAVTLQPGSRVTAASQSAIQTQIAITGNGITVGGSILAGYSSTLSGSMLTGDVFSGGAGANSAGGIVTLTASGTSSPSVVIAGTGVVATQSGSAAAGRITIDGCAVSISGLVASVSKDAANASVTVRSASTITVDGRDLGGAGTRRGIIRADATHESAATYSVNLYAAEAIQVLGPASGAIYAVRSNGGNTSKDGSGTINVISLDSTVTASGRAFQASNTDSGDQGGKVNVSAKENVTLDTASIVAAGDFTSTSTDRKGGAISVRSYSGQVSWQNGSGDVRPVGSSAGIAAASQGTITITHCSGYSIAGSTFPTNGSPVGVFPTIIQTCSPAGPSLPPSQSLPDCNDPPVANGDAYSVAEGGSLNVAAPGVLGNDVDPDGDPITAILVSGPAHSTSFTFNADGSFSYVHDGGETLTDSFTYKANDGTSDSNVATVAITITPVNDAPVANDDSYSVAEGGTINYAAPGVLANDTDADGPSMAAILVSGPAHAASFTLNADGSFVYVHDGSETLTDSFTYKANDGSLDSNVATASITITPVNDAPVANNDAYATSEGGTLNVTVPGVLGNDTDAENDALSAVLVSGPASASSFTLNADGSFTYVHNGGETTSDSFTYKANDGSLDSNVATVNITISAVNDAPVADDDGPYTVAEGGTLTIVVPGVLGNDTDAENDSLTAVLVSGPANASSFTLNADGSFTYVHDGSETTSDSFTYVANDGSANSNVATVTITITAVNDAPVAVGDAYSVAEGGTLNVAAPGVLGNDTDAENDSLTATLVSGPASATSFTLNADGSFSYVHDGGETTSDSFSYKASDGSLDSNVVTVNITINGVNDAPVALADGPYSVNEGGTITVAAPGVLANDTDAENDALTAVLVSGPANASSFTLNADGSFSYVHDGSETTSDSFTYKANDGTDDSNVVTVTIAITLVNDAPVAVADAYSVAEGGTLNVAAPGVLANDTDAENDALTAVLVSGPANASSFTLNADGSFSYVHNGGETSTDSFTYRANDGTANSNIVTVTIAITPVNDAPVANPDTYNTGFHGTLNVAAPGVLGNDTDAENDGLTAILVSGASQGTLVLNADGSFSYTHTGASLGTDSFTYQVQDANGGISNTTTVTINIANQAPVANGDSFLGVGNTELRVGTGPSLNPAVVISGSVLANDTDADGGPSALVVTTTTTPSANGGSVTMNPNGSFNYFPPVGFLGTDSFSYTITDGVATSTATVTITMNERVWYVNTLAAGTLSGRSHDPFSTLGQAQAASVINDYIHVAQGTYAGGIVLKNGQRLIGSGVPLVVGPYTLANATVRPTLGNTITLANANTIAGLTVAGISNGISGTGVSGNTSITQVGITSGASGIVLTNVSGPFSLTDVRVTPGGSGVVISGGSPAVTATNLDVVTSGAVGISANAGSLNIAAGSDGSTVATTNAIAVDLNNLALNVSLRSVSASGSTHGIRLANTTGPFGITGNASVAGSGGTIQNTTQRGASFIGTGGVALGYVNFTNAATANGDTAAVCGNTAAGTNLNCNAAIHFANVTSALLAGVVVNGSAQIGINGNNVSNVTMNNVQVTNAGNETFEHGVQFVNLTGGSNNITNSTFSNNYHRQFTVQNSTGTLNLGVASSAFTSNGAATGAQGVLISGNSTANMTVIGSNNTFTGNFSTGWQSDAIGTATMNVTLSNGAFTNNGGGAIVLATAGGSSMTYSVTGNTSSGSHQGAAISILKGTGSTGSMTGTVSGNTIGLAGVPGSACAVDPCDAISLNANGSGTFTTAVDNNTVRNFEGRAIALTAGNTIQANAAIRNNVISQPGVNASSGVFAQSGLLLSDTSSLCADIQGNTISGTYVAGGIRVRNRFAGTTFRLPGFPGPGNSTAAVQTFLSGQNGGTTVTATISGNTFGGGASCVAP